MLLETIAIAGASLTVITLASLRFARFVIEYDEDPLEPKSEPLPLTKRRELLVSLRDKANQTWLHSSGSVSDQAFRRIAQLDRDIVKLDDEEVRKAEGKL